MNIKQVLILGIMLVLLTNIGLAWYDSDYKNRRLINCSNVADGTPIMINGSTGVGVNGTTQYIWTQCDSSIYLYYNDKDDYVVGTDSDAVAFEVEQGNGTSYNPEDVWTDYVLVYHMQIDPSNVSRVLDSSPQNNHGGFESDPVLTAGVYGNALDFDDDDGIWSDSNLSIGGSTTNRTYEVWSKFDTIENFRLPFDNYDGTTHTAPIVLSDDWYLACGDGDWATGSSADTDLHYHFISYDAPSTQVEWYIDNARIGTGASKTPPAAKSPLYVGQVINNADWETDGMIDEMRVYSGVHPTSYIAEVYNNKINTAGYGDMGAFEVNVAPTPTVTIPVIGNVTLESTLGFNTTFENWTMTGFDSNANATYDVFNVSWYNTTDKTLTAIFPLGELNQTGQHDVVNSNDGTFSGYTFNDGTVSGATLTDGKYGQGYSFDNANSDNIKISDLTIAENSSFTVCAWAYPLKVSSTGGIVSADNQTYRQWYMASSNIRMYNAAGTAKTSSAGALTQNQWNFICMGYDSDTDQLKGGRDGEFNVLLSDVGGLRAGVPNIAIGGYYDYAEAYSFNGTLDEVYIWDKALSEAEIKDQYENGTHPITGDGLVASYEFEGNAKDTNNIVQGKYGGAVRFDNGQYIEVSSPDINNMSSMTITAWINHLSGTSDYIIQHYDGDADGRGFYVSVQSSAIRFLTSYDGDDYGYIQTGDQGITEGGWKFITMTYDEGNAEIYVDGELAPSSSTGTFGTQVYSPEAPLRIGSRYSDSNYFNGSIDDVRIYNYTLSSDQIKTLYEVGSEKLVSDETSTGEEWTLNVAPMSYTNFGTTSSTDFTIDDYSITIIQDKPVDQYVTNSSSLDLVCNASKSMPLVTLGNITLNIYDGNNTLYDTYSHTTSGNNYSMSYTASFTTGNYSWECLLDELIGDKTATVGNRTWWTDTEAPVLVEYQFNEGQPIYSEKNLTGFFNYTDSNLFKLNVTIDGSEIYSAEDINGTAYNYNLTYNVTTIPLGNHTIQLTMYDSHTAQYLKESYKVSKPILSNKLSFDTNINQIEIEPVGASFKLINPFSTERLTDRYTFDYKPEKVSQRYVFEVTTQSPLHIINKPESVYRKWLVSGNNWIDFYLPNSKTAKLDIELVDDYTAIVTIDNAQLSPDGKLHFNSIGELNSRTDTFSFYTYNVTMGYTSIIGEAENQTTTLDVLLNGTPYNTSIDAQFSYNGTTKSHTTTINGSNNVLHNSTFITPITNATVEVTGTWYLNVSSDSNTFTFNQTIIQLAVDNCSTYGNKVLKITILREDYPAQQLNASMEAELIYWADSISTYKQANLDYVGNSTYYVCLLNESSSILSDIYLQYTPSGSFTHRWYAFGYNLTSGIMRNESIYNFNETASKSDLKITTRQNSNYNYYSDVIGKLQRLYLAEGVWRTVQMDRSGDFGQLFYNIKEEDTDYKILFTDISNNLLKTTDSLKFVCTDGLCDLTVLLDPYSATSAATESVGINYTYTQSAGTIDVTWTDAAAGTNSVTTTIKKIGGVSDTYICNTTQIGASGSYSCDVSSYTGDVEVQVLDDGEIVITEWVHLNSSMIGQVIGENEGSIWSIIIIAVCAMAGIFSPVGAIIMTVFGLVIIYVLGLFTPLTLTFVVIAGIVGILIGFIVRN